MASCRNKLLGGWEIAKLEKLYKQNCENCKIGRNMRERKRRK